MDRRRFLALSTATLAVTASSRVFASRSMKIGGATLSTVSDGSLTLPPDFIFGPMPQEDLAGLLQRHGIERTAPLTPPCNITVLRDDERVVLFDAGAGTAFQDGVGTLVDALDAIDIAPEDVTHVVFTHGHPDHLWGILDDFDDPLFSDATHMMGRVEFEYWMNPATVDSIGNARAAFAAGAKRRLEMIEDEIVLFDDGDEVLAGIAAVALPGHTPGHMGFQIGDGALVCGDAIGNPHVAFERPDWPSGSDQDQGAAATTRKALLDRLVADNLSVIGFHLPEGGIGRVARAGAGYRLLQDM